jgi:hypothetical protein
MNARVSNNSAPENIVSSSVPRKTIKHRRSLSAWIISSSTADFIFLTALYILQGIPLGLTFGSIPFLLKSGSSPTNSNGDPVTSVGYAQIGLFSLAGYPYSLKLLWSPIVDFLYSPSTKSLKFKK